MDPECLGPIARRNRHQPRNGLNCAWQKRTTVPPTFQNWNWNRAYSVAVLQPVCHMGCQGRISEGQKASRLNGVRSWGIFNENMVDIHCHILPGLDDGAESLDEALQMGEMAIADGITHVMGTPHSNDEYRFDPVLVRERRDELQKRFGERLKIATGCDFHLSYENLQDIRTNPAKYTLNQLNYLLVEFADFAIPPKIEDALHHLQLAGITPIITHPERNGLIRAKPERLYGWIHQGCYVQVTASSLLGRFGSATQRLVNNWLGEGRIHFFATDAHNLTSRPMRMRAAYEVVAKERGEEVARALFQENPLAAFEGRPLPYVPEPEDFGAAQKRKKRFFFF